MTKLNINIEIDIVERFENENTIARIFYPNEGNRILIMKGLNKLTFEETIRHEIGHLFDWYLSEGNQSKSIDIREINADIIGNFKKN